MNNLRKTWMPWTAARQFPSDEAFGQWLQKQLKFFGSLRLATLVLAAGFLVVGYVLDRRPILLLTILPLAGTLLLTKAIEKTEAAGKETQS